jgi:hypothetical protein
MQWARHPYAVEPFGFLVLAQFRKKCLSGALPPAQSVMRALIAQKTGVKTHAPSKEAVLF